MGVCNRTLRTDSRVKVFEKFKTKQITFQGFILVAESALVQEALGHQNEFEMCTPYKIVARRGYVGLVCHHR